MRPFRLSPEARRDVQEVWAYIARDSVEAAARVRREIRYACRRLAQHPYAGTSVATWRRLSVCRVPTPREALWSTPGQRPDESGRGRHECRRHVSFRKLL